MNIATIVESELKEAEKRIIDRISALFMGVSTPFPVPAKRGVSYEETPRTTPGKAQYAKKSAFSGLSHRATPEENEAFKREVVRVVEERPGLKRSEVLAAIDSRLVPRSWERLFEDLVHQGLLNARGNTQARSYWLSSGEQQEEEDLSVTSKERIRREGEAIARWCASGKPWTLSQLTDNYGMSRPVTMRFVKRLVSDGIATESPGNNCWLYTFSSKGAVQLEL